MKVVLIDDNFGSSRDTQKQSIFDFLERTDSLPKFGHDYTVEEEVKYEHGIVGYRLREIQGIFPNGSPITFWSDRFLVLNDSDIFVKP